MSSSSASDDDSDFEGAGDFLVWVLFSGTTRVFCAVLAVRGEDRKVVWTRELLGSGLMRFDVFSFAGGESPLFRLVLKYV